MLLIFCFQQTQKFEEIEAFDPYQILELEKGGEDRLIKKAFRKMSLRWHPDKNRNNPLVASAKFV